MSITLTTGRSVNAEHQCELSTLTVDTMIVRHTHNQLLQEQKLNCMSRAMRAHLHGQGVLQGNMGCCTVFKPHQLSSTTRCEHVQEERLKALYEQHQQDRLCLAILAEQLPGGFSKGQISSQLRKLGLKKSKGQKRKGREDASEVIAGRCTDAALYHDCMASMNHFWFMQVDKMYKHA